MFRMWCFPVVALVFLASWRIGLAQIAGPNVNMVSGTKWPGGDPNLQKQNEPSIAVSTRNPLHLVAGANDYRTVDFSGMPFVDEEGVNHDAWPGFFKSYDGGLSWQSTLLPGCSFTPKPGEPNPCAGSPLTGSGRSAGADPTVRSGTNGMFYYSFIAFDRNNKKNGAVAVARLIDDNNRESPVLDESNGNGGLNAGKDPIRYLDTSIVDSNAGGQFSDKPFLAVDVPRAGAAQCVIPGAPGQTFAVGNVYVAYTIFVGNDNNIRSKIMFAVSSDCARTWRVQKLSESSSVNQGATVAIDPGTGAIYVAWRRFKNTGGTGQILETDNILTAKSVDGGQSFSKAAEVISGGAIQPFDIGTLPSVACATCGPQFRTNSLPTIAVVPGGVAYVAWAQRNAAGESRIVISSSTDGANWTSPAGAEGWVQAPYATSQAAIACGHQFMPALTHAAGKLMLLFYDLREDHTMALYTPSGPNLYWESRDPMKNPNKNYWDPAANVFSPTGAPSDGGLSIRHTLDVRLIQMTPPMVSGLTSVRVSQYHFGAMTSNGPIRQLQFNPPNLNLFRNGQVPFIGDFVDIAAVPFVPDGAGGWKFNTENSNSVVFHAVWTDNRNVRPTNNVSKYAPPGSSGGASRFDSTQSAAVCTNGLSQPGAMNQDIYTARIDQGIVTGALTNAKPLNMDRSFSFFVRNTGDSVKYFNLSLDNQPSGAAVSFKPTASLTNLCVAVGARSGVSRVVFAKANANTKAGIRIAVTQFSGCPGLQVPGGLQSNILLNNDSQNPEIENSLAPETFNPEIENPEIENPEIENPEIENPEIENPEIENPEIENPEIENPEIENPEIENPEIENPEIENPEIENVPPGSKITDISWKVRNNGSATSTYNPKLLLAGRVPTGVKTQLVVHKFYKTSTSKTGVCAFRTQSQTVTLVNIPNPKFYSSSDGNLTTAEIENGAVDNATFSLAKGEVARITVRALGANSFDAGTFFTTSSKPVVVSLPPNPGGVTPIALVITTMSLPNGFAGTNYTQAIVSAGGTGPYTWSLSGAPAWLGINGTGSTATLSGIPPAMGTYSFTVKVTDSAPTSNTQTLALTVNKGDTTTTIASDLPDPSVTGQPVAVAYSVTTAGGVTPTGNVTVTDGAVSCTGTVAAGNCTFTLTSAGSKTLTATYSGDANFNPSTSAGVSHQVNKANTGTSAVPSANPSVLGQLVSFTATVTTAGPGSGVPAGSVQFLDGATTLGMFALNGSGQATYSTAGLAVGTHSITAQYLGNSNFNSSTSPAVLQVVSMPAGSSLQFVTQPSNASAGVSISPAVQVRAVDATNAVIPGINITLTIGLNPGAGTLSGTTSAMTDATGVATFANLSINNAANGYTLMATAGALSAVSNAFSIFGPAMVNCSYPSASIGGDFIERGFYVGSYPGTGLSRVDLKFASETAGTYNVSLTARAGTYGGPVLGTGTATVTLSNDLNAFVPATFVFPSTAAVTAGSTVTFALTGPAPNTVYYAIPSNGDASCPVTETESTTPPLDVFRRNGVNVTVY